MCYPEPGPKCSVFLGKQYKHIANDVKDLYYSSSYYFKNRDKPEEFILYASSLKGQEECARAYKYMKEHSYLYKKSMRFLQKAMRKGEKLRENQLRAYDQSLIKIAEKTLESPGISEIQLTAMVKQVSRTTAGKDYLMRKIEEGMWYSKTGAKDLYDFKKTGSQRIQECINSMTTLEENKEFMDKDSEDYKSEHEELIKQYKTLISKYGGILTVEENNQLDYWRHTLDIPVIEQKPLDKEFVCKK